MKDEKNTVLEKPKHKFRYFCEGCTNVAFYGAEPFRWQGELTCAQCSKRLDCKLENWLQMSEEEQKQLIKTQQNAS